MAFEHIRKLQQEYVDKYVVVDEHRPELRRFHGLTGVVKTINMNGNALVQFDGYNNIGWYDIDVDYLRVVDPPAPKEDPPAPRIKEAKPKDPAP
jgi:hypothetical protein